ncbi:MAG: porin [Planctomycetota bacterium]
MKKTMILSSLAGVAASAAPVLASADEVRAIVAEMMADAQTRSSLLQSGGMAGYDNGFMISDASGNNTLKINGGLQFRYTASFLDDNNITDDYEGGFSNPRTQLWFSGNVGDKAIGYEIRGEFSDGTTGGTFNLQNAFLTYSFDNGLQMKFGQFRPDFARERNVRGFHQLAADRSLTGELFGQTETQGIQLSWNNEDFRWSFSFSDGLRSRNVDFPAGKGIGLGFDPLTGNLNAIGNTLGGEADLAFTGRVEFKFNGAWDQFDDFTSMPGSDYAGMVGVAGHYEYTDGDSVAGADDLNYFSWTVDASVEGDGWNAFIAGYGQHIEADSVLVNNILNNSGDVDVDNFGLIVQGGIFIPETDWELFARYDGLFADDDLTGGDDIFNTLTFGTNWYWSGHAAKFTFDIQYFINDAADFAGVPGFGPDTRVGFLSSGESEFALRAQFQLLF